MDAHGNHRVRRHRGGRVHDDGDRSCATRSDTSTDVDRAFLDVDATVDDCTGDLADVIVDDDPVPDDAAGVDDGATGHRHVGPVHDDPGVDDPGSA
jgi:hypothetical protein